MDLVFLDTSFLVAYYNADDINHEDACEFIKEMDGMVGLAMSDYILDEVLTVLLV